MSETEKNAGITDVTVYVRLIEDASGCDKIEKLQIHENLLVCEKSYTILENYFNLVDVNHVIMECYIERMNLQALSLGFRNSCFASEFNGKKDEETISSSFEADNQSCLQCCP